MTIETGPLEVTDFSGGLTDYYIDGRPDQYQEADNLLINVNKKLITRPGSELYQEEQLPLGAFRINSLIFYQDVLLAIQNKRAYRVFGGFWSEITGPAGGTFFPTGATDMVVSHSEWQGHTFLTNDQYSSPQKFFRDSTSTYRIRNAGLPDVPAGVVVPNPAGAGSTYLYAFVLRYSYTVGTVSFLDRGPVYFYPTTVTGGAITGGNTVSITLPVALTTVENWDSASIAIEIYRTLDVGDVYYRVGQTTLGTTPFIDGVPDSTLANNETLYTTDGSFSNSTPPKAKFVHIINDTGYYANILDGSETNEYLVLQSIPSDPDSVPASFFAETEQKIKGLSSIFDRPLVFCDQYVYRIDGRIDSTGVGQMILTRIEDNAGCMGQNSIVRTTVGIFWAGINGFYWSDGFSVKMISYGLNKTTYRNFVENATTQKHIYGVYDASENRVYWAVSKDDINDEPNKCIVLDLKWGITENSVFTTISGGESFKPTALAFKDKILYRGDSRGYVLQHAEGTYRDLKVDTGVDPSLWVDETIIHSYKSCFVDFGSKFLRKFVPRILVSAANTTNLSLAITSSNDNNRVVGELKPIRYRGNIIWGDSLPPWGDSEALWNAEGIIEQWRRFPSGGLRCNYKQIQLTNAFVQVFNSDTLGEVTVDSTAKTATLGGSLLWPLREMVDYYISFENDGYTLEYLITAATSTTLTFSDSNGASPDGQFNFIIYGQPKGEVLELNGYVIHWSFLSKSFTPFSSSSLGSDP